MATGDHSMMQKKLWIVTLVIMAAIVVGNLGGLWLASML